MVFPKPPSHLYLASKFARNSERLLGAAFFQRPFISVECRIYTRVSIRRFSQFSRDGTRISRYSPWSDGFPWSLRTRATLQALVYSAILLVATDYIMDRGGAFGSSSSDTSDSRRKYGTQAELQNAIQELRTAFPDPLSVVTDPEALATYGSSDFSYHPSTSHGVIVTIITLLAASHKFDMGSRFDQDLPKML